jgi:glycosyltransferase involved in cell wall biosynthesis
LRRGRLLVLSKPNGGKAEALNLGLNHVEEEIYVGIDADTVIARDAVSKLVRHFADPRVGAVAGNAKVGNRINTVDAVAGSRIHHEPEFRATRDGSVQRGDGGSGRDWGVADERGEEGGLLSGEHGGRGRGSEHEPAGGLATR